MDLCPSVISRVVGKLVTKSSEACHMHPRVRWIGGRTPVRRPLYALSVRYRVRFRAMTSTDQAKAKHEPSASSNYTTQLLLDADGFATNRLERKVSLPLESFWPRPLGLTQASTLLIGQRCAGSMGNEWGLRISRLDSYPESYKCRGTIHLPPTPLILELFHCSPGPLLDSVQLSRLPPRPSPTMEDVAIDGGGRGTLWTSSLSHTPWIWVLLEGGI
jgi:hypothetical protein